jgi:beta-glucosidase
VQVEVTVTNTGDRVGSEVVQLYVSSPSIPLTTPTYQLRGISKVKELAPGAIVKASLELDKFAFAYWDVISHQWKIVPGVYELHVGNSSDNLVVTGKVEIGREYSWRGL